MAPAGQACGRPRLPAVTVSPLRSLHKLCFTLWWEPPAAGWPAQPSRSETRRGRVRWEVMMGPDSLACWARRSRGRRLWPAVAGLLGASLASIACVAPAHALLRREPLGLLATGQALSLVGDGHRYAAFQEAGGPITLLDLARGGRRTVDPGAGPCHLGGFGGGWMSISCLGALGSLTRAELVGVRTLTRVAVKGVPGSPEVVHGADQQLGAVGSRWVIVSTCDPDAHGACTLSYVEWRTGRRVPAGGQAFAAVRRRVLMANASPINSAAVLQ